MRNLVCEATDYLGWMFCEVAFSWAGQFGDGVLFKAIAAPSYRLGNWFYGVCDDGQKTKA
jgi:hypothetical protein